MSGDLLAPHRRRLLLEALDADTDRTLSSEMLQRMLKMHAYNVSLDVIHADLRWLEREEAVTVGDGAPGVCIARLAARGVDCVAGRIRIAGVDRPPA